MGLRLIRDRSQQGGWWLMAALFTVCVVGWSLALSFKVGAADVKSDALGGAPDRTYDVAGFNRVSISGSVDVVLLQGEQEAVHARGSKDDLEYLEVFVENDTLIIKEKHSSWWSNRSMEDVRLLVLVRDIERLALSGSGDLAASDIAAEQFAVAVSGSSDVMIEQLETADLGLRISGSSNVSITGTAEQQEVKISGSGDYSAAELASTDVSVRISGSGDAVVAAANTLDVRISGSGNVAYLGSPRLESRVSGSGEVAAYHR